MTASASHSGLVDGLKLTVSGDPKNLPGAKVALQLLRDAVGVKCDLTKISSGAATAYVPIFVNAKPTPKGPVLIWSTVQSICVSPLNVFSRSTAVARVGTA